MAKRMNPVEIKRSRHEKMLDEMHDALYTLGSKLRPAPPSEGSKMLPKHLKQQQKNDSAAAKKHVEAMHKAMTDCGKEY